MVSDELKDEFLYELWITLERAGLSPDPNSIIGCKYVFKCCEDGPILCGTITAIGIYNFGCFPEDLRLCVSSPEVYGQKIRGITRAKDGWNIEVYANDELSDRFFHGEFKLFFWPIPTAPDASGKIFKSNP